MCTTCGCSNEKNDYKIYSADGLHHHHGNGDHHHDHDHGHSHAHSHHNSGSHLHVHAQPYKITLETDILNANKMQAERNRGYFEAKKVLTFNLMSSPGSGKTSLLERTLTDLKTDRFYVIEGDQQTTNDADRIKATGTTAIQINTGDGCHLDARMVNDAVKELAINENSILFIENVGNLVCPSLFDLGETKRVVIISVTEGDDKPLKYPNMFHSADICIINKTDLLPYVRFDLKNFKENALKVNHHLEFIELSVYSGEGMPMWYDWLRKQKS